MTTAMKTTKTVSVWLDTMSGEPQPAWIVSIDDMQEDGKAAYTRTLRTFEVELDDDGIDPDNRSMRAEKTKAIEYAHELAERKSLPVRVDD